MRSASGRRGQRGQVLILLFLGALLFGASAAGLGTVFDKQSVKHLRERIATLVAEDDRRKALDGVLDRMLDEGARLADGHQEQGKRLLQLMQRHDATPAEFDALTAEADALNLDARRHLLDLRFALREKLTADEWRALFGHNM